MYKVRFITRNGIQLQRGRVKARKETVLDDVRVSNIIKARRYIAFCKECNKNVQR